jgi:hypothetical protein
MEANERHAAERILGDIHRQESAVANTNGIRPKPADRSRGHRPEVRNPVLGLKSFRALQQLPEETRSPLVALLLELSADASSRAEMSWKRKKAPMAAYWKAASVYAKHIARAIQNRRPQS